MPYDHSLNQPMLNKETLEPRISRVYSFKPCQVFSMQFVDAHTERKKTSCSLPQTGHYECDLK